MLKMIWSLPALKYLAQLPRNRRDQIRARVAAMTDNPFGHQVRKLKGRDGYRLRVGGYRVIFTIDKRAGTILVVTVAPRGRAYR